MPTGCAIDTSVKSPACGVGYGVSVLDLPTPSAFFRMNGAAGASETDSIGGLVLTPTNAPGSAAGKIGNCRTFASASSQRLSAPDAQALKLNVPSTIGGWFNLTTKTVNMALIFKGSWISFDLMEFQYLFTQSSNYMQFALYTPSGNITLNTLSNPTAGTWYCFLVRWDGARLSSSINGANFSAGVAAGLPNVTTGPLTIGDVNQSPFSPYNGQLDALAFWRGTLLTDAQAANFYNGGAGREFYQGYWW